MSTNRHEKLLPSPARRETFFGANNTDTGSNITIAGVPLDIGTINRAADARYGPAAARCRLVEG